MESKWFYLTLIVFIICFTIAKICGSNLLKGL